jgi:hypothetical protein
MRFLRLIAIVLGTVGFICGIRLRAQEPQLSTPESHPAWKADAQQFGYERFPRRSVRPLRLVVSFLDNDQLAIAWVTPDTTTENRRNAPKVGEPAHLDVVMLDAKTGLKQSQKNWPTPYHPVPHLFGLPEGKVLICTDNSLRLLSASLDTVREQELPNHGTCVNVGLQLSPSKHTLGLTIRANAEHSRHLELFNVQTFTALSNWTAGLGAGAISHETAAFSDHWVVGYCGVPADFCTRRFDEDWHPIHIIGLDTRMDTRHRIPVSFVSDDVLAIGRDGVTTVATVSGDLLFQIRLPKGHYLLPPIASAGQQRFAVIEGRLRGLRSEPLDMYPFGSNDRALVYSIKNRRAIFSLKLKGTSPWTPRNIHEEFLAVSPDGRSLAVVSDGLLNVYTLPSDDTSQQH